MRSELMAMIDREIENKLNGKRAGIKLQLNALSDDRMIEKLYEAARAGVTVRMIVRSIMCAVPKQKSFKKSLYATSIVDEFLEHDRILVFENDGDEEIIITSADWMVRNLDYRLEVAVRILDSNIKRQLLDMLAIKCADNVKARILDNQSSNHYVKSGKKRVRAQLDIYRYLHNLAQAKPSKRQGK
jgi:polyphosphate kinase